MNPLPYWLPVYAPANDIFVYYRVIATEYAVFNSKSQITHYEPGLLYLPYSSLMVARYNERMAA